VEMAEELQEVRSRRASATSATPGSIVTMRKPAAPEKPFALSALASLGELKDRPCSRGNTHRQRFDAAHKTGIDPLRFADHLDAFEALEHFLPHDLQLQFGQPHADAAVDAEAERQMGAGPGAVDDETRRVFRCPSSSRLPETYHITTRSPS